MIRFFDAHCDTLRKVAEKEVNFITGEGKAHVTLPSMLKAGSCVQVFACWVFSENYPGKERERAELLIETAEKTFAESLGRLHIARTAEEIHRACQGEGTAALLALEGADPLEGKAENLAYFKELGVLELIIAWGDNVFAGTVFGSGSGLTGEGAKLIEIAEALGIVLDVSHLSDRAFEGFCEVAKRPFVASHSNCRALCPSPRNLTDDMIRRIAERGGAIGINLSSGFLSPEFHAEESVLMKRFLAAPKEDTDKFNQALEECENKIARLVRPPMHFIADHVRHLIQTGGEDCAGLGGDLDGVASLPDGIEGIASYPAVADLLLQSGLTTAQVEKVCWKNFERVFCEIIA
jgi:membrane dipeptidase